MPRRVDPELYRHTCPTCGKVVEVVGLETEAYCSHSASDTRRVSRMARQGRRRKEESGQYVGIYFIRAGSLVKIGKTTKGVKRRVAALQTTCPDEIVVVDFEPCSSEELNRREREWHKHFAEARRRGEWFELSDNDVLHRRSARSNSRQKPQKVRK